MLHFENFVIDPDRRTLVANGEEIMIEPKAFDCMAYLVSQRGRAVGKDELIGAVWGKADVSDAMLGQAILKARRAVADDGSSQRVIRTAHRFGYEWIAPIHTSHRSHYPHMLQQPFGSDAALSAASAFAAHDTAGPNYAFFAGLGLLASALLVIWASIL